jgi:competence protein ComEC
MNPGQVDLQTQASPLDRDAQSGNPILTKCSLAWMVGIVLSYALSHQQLISVRANVWLLSGIGMALALLIPSLLFFHRKMRWTHVTIWIALILTSCAWAMLQTRYVQANHIAHRISQEPRLVRVMGRVDGHVNNAAQQRGEFGRRFGWQGWACLFVLDVQQIQIDGKMQATKGKLLVKIKQPEHRLKSGMQITATGWASTISPVQNPGEFDYKAMLTNRGVEGRLTLANRHNWQADEQSSSLGNFSRWRHSASDRAAASLRLGMNANTQRLGFLDAILLGRRSRDVDGLTDSFKRVGLAHLLSISGAHLAILLGVTWLAARLLISKPRDAVLVVLAVLSVFLLIVPLRVPIIRAGLMATLFCLGSLTGRRFAPISVLALASLLILIWRPQDLFNPGFQLSFGVVAALLLFTQRVSHWIWAPPLIPQPHDASSASMRAGRILVDYLAVSLVAFCVAAPLVAYHYQMISPLNVLLTIMALPVVTCVLAIGYLKVLVGLALPSVGGIMAGPLEWLTDALTGLVEHAATWPGATIELTHQPSVLWVVTSLAVVIALLGGWFAKRPWPLAACLLISALWVGLPNHHATAALLRDNEHAKSIQINMFAVGDGSCYLIRTPGKTAGDRPHITLFDCGSQSYTDVGGRSIVPALRHLGITKIDTVILSHADLDHFCGVLDVLDQTPADHIFAPPQLIAKARANPRSAVGFLIDQLGHRGYDVQPIARGHSKHLAGAGVTAKVLWPPADFQAKRDNDTSIVVGLRLGDKGPHDLLLCGDIASQAMTSLLEADPQLRADVVELPHHGSFTNAATGWIKTISPRIVLQSCGKTRLSNDKWADALLSDSIHRLMTAKMGMVQLRIDPNGKVSYWSINNPKVTQIDLRK